MEGYKDMKSKELEQLERDGLLDDEETLNDGASSTDSLVPKVYTRRRGLSVVSFFVTQVALLVLYSLLAVTYIQFSRPAHGVHDAVRYNPARSAMQIEMKEIDGRLYQDNPYRGPPTPEVEAAWEQLFDNAYIRLSPTELENLNLTSVPIGDGSGDYLGALDMYHQLHCVKYLFEYIHPEYYTMPVMNIDVGTHLNHCLDQIRQVIMCHADATIMTYEYYPTHPIPWPKFELKHECRNWDMLNEWAGQPSRHVSSDLAREGSRNPNYIGGSFDGHVD